MTTTRQFRSASLWCALPVIAAGALTPVTAQARARHHHHTFQAGGDFACAVHVAYGEANGKGKREAAIVINGLVKSAARDHVPVCVEARRRYAPRNGSSPDIIAAADNVMRGGATLVPARFAYALEFRAPGAHGPAGARFQRLGQATPGGNVYWAPR